MTGRVVKVLRFCELCVISAPVGLKWYSLVIESKCKRKRMRIESCFPFPAQPTRLVQIRAQDTAAPISRGRLHYNGQIFSQWKADEHTFFFCYLFSAVAT